MSTVGAYHQLRVVAAGLLVAGCAGAASSAGPDATASAARQVTAVPVTTASTSPPSDVAQTPRDRRNTSEEATVISFSVEGGFTNQMRSLRIDAGGGAFVEVSGRSTSGQLDAARVEAIVAELDASGLFDHDRSYPAPDGADQQRFEIVYDGATVVAYDATVPAELTEAVRLLEESLRDTQR